MKKCVKLNQVNIGILITSRSCGILLWWEGGAWCPTPSIPARHWIGKIGGGNTELAQKNGFGVIPYFLEITNVEEAYLIFEIFSVLPKVYLTNMPHR